jgi:hypothetical protein|nr:MAG TPA: hypothetical protein [Caudoviricetes sp.]
MKLNSNDISIDNMHHGAYSSLAGEFYNNGYELTVDEDCNLTAVAIKNAEMLPKIEIKTVIESGSYCYSPKAIFPVLDFDDMEYWDDFTHWTNKYAEIGKMLSDLVEFTYNPNMWED